ncbi:MAG TPA: pyridoxal-phosphate dependent enzyme [bacterium]|nr:pyridoxal-phosphate dependent enzyme [bacterium]
MRIVDLHAIRKAGERIRPFAHRTPVLTCAALNQMAGADLFFKCENFQKAGAFKFRGACNTVLSLPDGKAGRGVVTHSSGNHAAALSLAARLRSIPAHIVMPSNAPSVKIAAVKAYGGSVTFCEPTLESRETTALQIVEKTGAELVHPYNDLRIIAGQGTAVLELLEDVPDLDMVLVPVGGGGLLSGSVLAAKGLNPKLRVIGCEPKNADDAWRSKAAGRLIPAGNPKTIADGLRTSLGSLTFPIIRDHVDAVWLAEEEAIVQSMRLIFERMKIVVEPSSAVPLAALLAAENPETRRCGILLSGGNVDLSSWFNALISV